MPLDPDILNLIPEMTAWRQDFHAHPETAYQEHRTSARIAELLRSFGCEVTTGLAGTGVVGSLQGGPNSLMFRADMDALAMSEENPGCPYHSRHEGKMHGCGHDGHMAMLLGAAKILAGREGDRPCLHFLFQPAEENEAGARKLVEEGLFQKFPVQAVFGLHNWPGLPAGEMAVRPGPMMASCDLIEIELRGQGTHAAMPHLGQDVVLAAAHLVTALQAAVARETDPLDSAVVSITRLHAGQTWNVMPASALLQGTVRALKPETQDRLERRLREITDGLAAAFGISARFSYDRRYPPTINSEAESDLAHKAAQKVAGVPGVHANLPPSMGAEDFAFLLREKPGAYAWLGTGRAGAASLHHPSYDFNDAALALGASWWVELAQPS
ncbi:MAG: M20 family metallopeptidase [Rhodospirillales bacterium]|nr:M20 family metallopeptidase [Rhodospirillales bacterium]